MRRTLWIAALLLLGSQPATAAKNADARRGLTELARSVQARRGVAHRHLVVIPLVPTAAPKPGGATVELDGIGWKPADKPGRERLVALDRPAVPGDVEPKEVVWPSGVVLRHGTDEHLTRQPLRIPTDAVRVSTAPVVKHTKADPPGPEATRSAHPLAPHPFRHTTFADDDPEAVSDLLGLAATLVGLTPDETPVGLAELEACPTIQTRLAAARKSVAGLASAYAGEVTGHVVFMGNRPVDVVLVPSPSAYQTFLKAAVPGLALTLVIWEELYGRDDPAIEAPQWDLLLAEANRVLEGLRGGSLKKQKRSETKTEAGVLWRVKAKLDKRRLAGHVGWLLTDDDGKALLIEAWPNGMSGPLPAPARKPGDPPIDEDPYNRKSGAMTKYFLERFLKRFERRRAAMGRR